MVAISKEAAIVAEYAVHRGHQLDKGTEIGTPP